MEQQESPQDATLTDVASLLTEIRDLQNRTRGSLAWISFLVTAWALLTVLVIFGAITVEMEVAGF